MKVSKITTEQARKWAFLGDVYVSMRLSATLACHMRLERFPMDVQVWTSVIN